MPVGLTAGQSQAMSLRLGGEVASPTCEVDLYFCSDRSVIPAARMCAGSTSPPFPLRMPPPWLQRDAPGTGRCLCWAPAVQRARRCAGSSAVRLRAGEISSVTMALGFATLALALTSRCTSTGVVATMEVGWHTWKRNAMLVGKTAWFGRFPIAAQGALLVTRVRSRCWHEPHRCCDRSGVWRGLFLLDQYQGLRRDGGAGSLERWPSRRCHHPRCRSHNACTLIRAAVSDPYKAFPTHTAPMQRPMPEVLQTKRSVK